MGETTSLLVSVNLTLNLQYGVEHNRCTVFPLIFHDISEEIPEASRPLITRLFQLWLVLALTLILNMVACITILISGSPDGARDLGASIGCVPKRFATTSVPAEEFTADMYPSLVFSHS
jgi:hypothetical protein